MKDKLASINASKNYRSVAISSILLKFFDWVVILMDGPSLHLNELQFAYQEGCSTVMCTWAALETIDYFLRNGICLRRLTSLFIVLCLPRCWTGEFVRYLLDYSFTSVLTKLRMFGGTVKTPANSQSEMVVVK